MGFTLSSQIVLLGTTTGLCQEIELEYLELLFFTYSFRFFVTVRN